MQAGYPAFATQPVHIAIDGYDKPAVRAQTEALFAEMKESGNFYDDHPASSSTTTGPWPGRW